MGGGLTVILLPLGFKDLGLLLPSMVLSIYPRLWLSNKLLQYIWRSSVPVLWRSNSWHGDRNKSLLSIFPIWAVRKHYYQLYKWTRLQLATIPTNVPLLNCIFYSCSCDRLCSAIWRTIVTSSKPSSPSRHDYGTHSSNPANSNTGCSSLPVDSLALCSFCCSRATLGLTMVSLLTVVVLSRFRRV
ncbi:RNA-binding (RRM/RBD/RNP motifs) family protein [Zea mays]|uniref:RNA-binding (RRM/RBD/RNP motifs) family protein n=1 Tax=Zea mays TaxID=4577 RepID=A0A1D6N5Q4_MAIZE|nr:RNA-binding (RRM/RBD/RNP motifs) family protein [Zea mays]